MMFKVEAVMMGQVAFLCATASRERASVLASEMRDFFRPMAGREIIIRAQTEPVARWSVREGSWASSDPGTQVDLVSRL
jgi:hypothetical protein